MLSLYMYVILFAVLVKPILNKGATRGLQKAFAEGLHKGLLTRISTDVEAKPYPPSQLREPRRRTPLG